MDDDIVRVHEFELAEFSEGDFVEHEEFGQGIVTGEMDDTFEFPVGEDDTEEVDASSDSPVYIVALLEGGIATANENELSGIGDLSGPGADVTSPDEAVEKSTEEAELYEVYNGKGEAELLRIPGVDDPEVGWENLPDGWTRKSVLQSWASLGGTFSSCYAKTLSSFGPFRAKRHCASHKDEVLQTERWRNRF